jgi:hypothetical protein
MDTKLHIKLGFKIDGIFFGWHNTDLYQLPYNQNGRYYGLRILKAKKTKNGWVYYHVRRVKFGLEKIRAMLQDVDWQVTLPKNLNPNNEQ